MLENPTHIQALNFRSYIWYTKFWLQKSETVCIQILCFLFFVSFLFFSFFGFGFSFVFPQISSGYFEYEFCEHLGLSSCLILLMQADFIIIMIIINFLGSVGWPQKTISFGLNNTQNPIQSNQSSLNNQN
jgi:hypothetical protein